LALRASADTFRGAVAGSDKQCHIQRITHRNNNITRNSATLLVIDNSPVKKFTFATTEEKLQLILKRVIHHNYTDSTVAQHSQQVNG